MNPDVKEIILRLIEILGTGTLGGIIVALIAKRSSRAEIKKSETESYSSQFAASKVLLDSTQELISISNQLIKTVETQRDQILQDNAELKKKYEEVILESRELKESTETLRKENHKVLAIANKLLYGIKILVTQLRSMNVEPLWQPPQEVLDTIDRRINIMKQDSERG